MRIMVIVNGYPRSGKDTAVKYMRMRAEERGFKTEEFSTIDPVRDMLLNSFGIDTSAKTSEDRLLLSIIGSALEDHSQVRTKLARDRFFQILPPGVDFMLFVHLREPELIKRLIQYARSIREGFATTVLVTRDVHTPGEFSNASDANVMNIEYGYVIDNSRSKGGLLDTCEYITDTIVAEAKHARLGLAQPPVEAGLVTASGAL